MSLDMFPLWMSKVDSHWFSACVIVRSVGFSSYLVRKKEQERKITTLWLFNIAMENDPFIDGLPIKDDDFPWLR